MTIPYKIERIDTTQFAIFPDKYINGENVSVEMDMTFSTSETISPIKNVTSIRYKQNDDILLVLEIACSFTISEEGLENLRKSGKIPVEFLRYMGTFSVGIARGVIHARTEGTVLNPVILPPANVNDSIKEDLPIKKARSKSAGE